MKIWEGCTEAFAIAHMQFLLDMEAHGEHTRWAVRAWSSGEFGGGGTSVGGWCTSASPLR